LSCQGTRPKAKGGEPKCHGLTADVERRCKLVDISDAIGGPTYEVRGHEQVRGGFIGGSFMLPVVARRVTSAAAGIEEIEMK
jgi:hypothetical protein